MFVRERRIKSNLCEELHILSKCLCKTSEVHPDAHFLHLGTACAQLEKGSTGRYLKDPWQAAETLGSSAGRMWSVAAARISVLCVDAA